MASFHKDFKAKENGGHLNLKAIYLLNKYVVEQACIRFKF